MTSCFTGYKPCRKDYVGVERKKNGTIGMSEPFSALKAAKTVVGPVRRDMNGDRAIIQRALDLSCFDQRQLGSCEAQAAIAGLMIVRPSTPMLSRRGLYLACLMRDGTFPRDEGTTGETVHNALVRTGVCLEEHCEYRDTEDEKDWTERPTIAALEEEWDHRIDATHRITSFDEQLEEDIRASIDAGRPVQDGGPCSQAYQNFFNGKRKTSVFTTMKPSIGGHARLLVGYWMQPDNSCWFLERGSYGDDVALEEFPGHVWVSGQCLRQYDEFFSYFAAPVFA